MTAPTSRPWRVGATLGQREGSVSIVHVADDLLSVVARSSADDLCAEHGGSPTANAALIVEAVNGWDAVRAERDALRYRAETLAGVLRQFANLAEYSDLVDAFCKCMRAHERNDLRQAFKDARAALALGRTEGCV